MNLLKRMERLGVPVTWTTALIGWRGPGDRLPRVSSGEVIGFAASRLTTGSAGESEALLRLVSATEDETGEIERCLEALARSEAADIEDETRKWQVVLLEELLETIDSSPVDGLIQLTDFWAQFNYPPDMPHIVQGVGNSIGPREYYTAANYEQLLARHRQWIEACRAKWQQ